MSTLFRKCYDSLGHLISVGDTVMGLTSGYKILGHVIDITFDKNNDEKYVIIPDIGCTFGKENCLKKQYKIGWKNVYKITTIKKAC